MLYLITIERGLHDTLMPWYTDLTPLFIFTSLARRKNAPQRGLNLLLCAASEMSERALDMLIWPLLSILNLHQTNFIELSKNPHNEWKLVTLLLAMIHLLDNIDIRVYKRLMMFYKDWMIQWCHCELWCEAGFDWHATHNWWPDDGMGSRHDKMSSGHETPVTKLLPRPPVPYFLRGNRDGVHFDFVQCRVQSPIFCKYFWLTHNPWQGWN